MDGYELGRIACPILVLQADRAAGGMLTDEEAGWLATKADDCTTVRVANAPHLIHWLDTPAVVRLVTGFLATL